MRQRWRWLTALGCAVLALLALASGAAWWIVLLLVASALYVALRPFGATVARPSGDEIETLAYAYLGTSVTSCSLMENERFGLLFRDEAAAGDEWRDLLARLRFLSEKR